MEILSVFDEAFRPYGRLHLSYDPGELLRAMGGFALPQSGTEYRPSIPALEACGIFDALSARAFGGLPAQLGMCWGHNTKLNCLEYHRSSEINIGEDDFILLLAQQVQITDGALDTGLVKAFRVPGGVPVELFATTLHYAPCQADAGGFRVAVALPKGTNTAKPDFSAAEPEDRWMTARNKWLLAHPDSDEAKAGAHVGLRGENLALD